MTREEALYKFDKNTGWFKDHPFDAVHNARKEFIELMNDFESRTCENCEFYKEENKQCTNEASIAYTSQEAIYFDDGCNKFEKRINNER